MSIYHTHHKYPRHFFKKEEWKHLDFDVNDPSNLIQLSIEDHAEEHRKLYEKYGYWEDKVAWKTLSGQISVAEAIKETQRLANLGNTHTKGRKLTKEHKDKIGKRLKGRIFKPETLEKMSLAKIGKSSWNKGLSKEKSHLFGRKRPDNIERFAKTYEVTSPTGETFIIKNLKKFCKDNNLCYCGMVRVNTGYQSNSRGWKCKSIPSVV